MHSQQLGIILENKVLFQRTPKPTSFTRVIKNCLNLTYELNFNLSVKENHFQIPIYVKKNVHIKKEKVDDHKTPTMRSS